ncbi:type II toxin-antitoxin system PemK/MazF family toxin [Halomonas korlensis]|uniref:mRNA interferase MazF n=1 Tax=Halomonas korlensis TaxID=463301 RepID=A0A1I7IX78_9GAMM|nr:type II toxin-antitoxin system PemK/MazF family toxin [Halomonas korlensis]SFU77504.1 mRNA interferase MazF [Halomonas korlensis]
MSFEAFDVVVVPFPFTDRSTTKRRPALVLSSLDNFNRPTDHVVLAMITSARNSTWPLDTEIQDLDAAGLPASSIVRMKLFTLDARLIIRQAGRLEQDDRHRVIRALKALMPAIDQ